MRNEWIFRVFWGLVFFTVFKFNFTVLRILAERKRFNYCLVNNWCIFVGGAS